MVPVPDGWVVENVVAAAVEVFAAGKTVVSEYGETVYVVVWALAERATSADCDAAADEVGDGVGVTAPPGETDDPPPPPPQAAKTTLVLRISAKARGSAERPLEPSKRKSGTA
jgi:hypothetical protein